MTGSTALWYASQATGLVSLVMFTLVMVLGVLTVQGRRLPGLPRFGTVGLHRSASLLAVAFLAVHVGTAVADSYVDINLIDTVVPYTAGWQPFWLGLGTVAVDLLIALMVSSLLRRRLGQRVWRGIHWLAYACWPVALVHGVALGEGKGEAMHGWALGLTAGCVAAVLAAVVLRLTRRQPPHSAAQVLAQAEARAAERRPRPEDAQPERRLVGAGTSTEERKHA